MSIVSLSSFRYCRRGSLHYLYIVIHASNRASEVGHQVSVGHEASPSACSGTQSVKKIGKYFESLPIVHSIDPTRDMMTMRSTERAPKPLVDIKTPAIISKLSKSRLQHVIMMKNFSLTVQAANQRARSSRRRSSRWKSSIRANPLLCLQVQDHCRKQRLRRLRIK